MSEGSLVETIDASEAGGEAIESLGPLQGRTLGRYEVAERLGAGGMGVVYAALDPELKRRVAIKVLRPRAGASAGEAARLLREARAMAQLSHEHVVTVHDVGTYRGRVFVAMELVDGLTFRAWGKTPRQPGEILDVLIAAGRGLVAVHAADLVHRDFKPDNVMIGRDGRVLVMDFGVARAGGESAPLIASDGAARRDDLRGDLRDDLPEDITRSGAMIGTPAYMAPEQFRGQLADARSDQFSFCVTAYEALFGLRPFAGASIGALFISILDGEIEPPPPGHRVPTPVVRAILRGLHADPW